MKNPRLINLYLLLPLLLLFSCTRQASQVTVTSGPGPTTVAIQASSFAFAPTHIVAHQGDRLLLHVSNLAGTAHNLSLKNPRGEVVLDKDLPAGATVAVRLDLAETGSWEFYCNRAFHEMLGMHGRIEVISRP